jgi:cobalt/nickel transport system permease protein
VLNLNSLSLRLHFALILVIGAATLKPNSWNYLSLYGAIAISLAVILRVPIRRLTGLLGTELIFLSFLALPLGLERASFLLVRSLICLLTMNSYLLILPPHSFAIALKSLPLPNAFKQNLLLTGQYLEILTQEVTRMQRSAELRGLKGKASWLRYASAAMIGALYLRSLERAERVYAAMSIRGYNGSLSLDSTLTTKERCVILITSIMTLALSIASYC